MAAIQMPATCSVIETSLKSVEGSSLLYRTAARLGRRAERILVGQVREDARAARGSSLGRHADSRVDVKSSTQINKIPRRLFWVPEGHL